MSKKKQPIKPLHDRLVLKPIEVLSKTAGGIIIPDTAKEKPMQGIVLYCGDGKKDEPMTVKVNDTVMYGKFAGQEIEVEGEKCLIMREADIMAIV